VVYVVSHPADVLVDERQRQCKEAVKVELIEKGRNDLRSTPLTLLPVRPDILGSHRELPPPVGAICGGGGF